MWQKDQRGWDCYTMSDMDRWYCRGKGYLPPRPIRKLWQPPIKMSVGQFSWLQEFPSPPPSPGCRTTSVNWVQCAPKTEPLATLCVRDTPSSHLLKIEGRTILLTSVELDTQFLISYSNQNPPTPTNKAAKLLIRCQDIFYLLLFHSDIFKIPTLIPKKDSVKFNSGLISMRFRQLFCSLLGPAGSQHTSGDEKVRQNLWQAKQHEKSGAWLFSQKSLHKANLFLHSANTASPTCHIPFIARILTKTKKWERKNDKSPCWIPILIVNRGTLVVSLLD